MVWVHSFIWEVNSFAQYSLVGTFWNSSYINSTDLSNLEFD